MRQPAHAGCGGGAGETHREQSRQGASALPNLGECLASGGKLIRRRSPII